MLPKNILKFLIGADCLAGIPYGPMQVFAEGRTRSVGCSAGE